MAINLNQKQTGTGFVNLNKYLQANKQNQLGQTIAGGLSKEAGALKEDVQNQSQEFQQKAESGRLGSAANVAKRQNVLEQARNIQNIGDLQQGDIDAFKKFTEGTYSGPSGLSNEELLRAKSQELSSLGQSSLNPQGRFGLLQKYVGKPQYTAGQQKLDNLLLGSTQPIKQAKKELQTVGLQTGKQIESAKTIADSIAEQNKQFAADTKTSLKTQEDITNKAIEDLTSQYKNEQADKFNRLQTALASRDLSASPELESLRGQQLFGVNPLAYLSQGIDPTKENVANLQQRAQLQALSKLSGRPADTFQFAQDVYDPNKAVSFDKDKLLSIVKPREEAYNRAITDFSNTSIQNSMRDLRPFAQSVGLPLNNLSDVANAAKAYEAWLTGPQNTGRGSMGNVTFGRGYDSLANARQAAQVAQELLARYNTEFQPGDTFKSGNVTKPVLINK